MLYSLFFINLTLFYSVLNGVLVFKLSAVHCCTHATISIQRQLYWYSYRQISVTIHRDIRPSMVTHTLNLCSAFIPSKVNTHTHSEHTPGAVGSHLCYSARGAVGGSVPCSRVSPQSWYWRRRECCTFTPPTYNSCRTWDSNSQPLDYESDSLTIRPQLPQTNQPNVTKCFKLMLFV